MDESNQLQSLLDSSGFPLQLAIEHLIKSTLWPEHPPWRVVATEHAWKDNEIGKEGFVDIVLEKGWTRMVIECKRPRNGIWMFLIPGNGKPQSRFRTCWSETRPEQRGLTGISEFIFKPHSLESKYCVIRGQAEGDRTLLERLASEIVLATECIAKETAALTSEHNMSYPYVYVPAIVTCADLFSVTINPERVSLEDGLIAEHNRERVSAIRFRKGLATSIQANRIPTDIREVNAQRERSVIVINSSHLGEILKSCGALCGDRAGPHPWDVLRDSQS